MHGLDSDKEELRSDPEKLSMEWSKCVYGELSRDHIFIDIISYIIPSSGEMRQ